MDKRSWVRWVIIIIIITITITITITTTTTTTVIIVITIVVVIINEFTQQDGRKKRTAKRLSVTNVTEPLLACYVVIFT